MLGTLDLAHREATVIGAGFAGLLISYRLLKAGFKVDIYEAGSHVGGLIQTFETDYGLVETAAHSFRSSPAILDLCRELNVPLVAAKSKAKFILRDGVCKKFPLTVSELIGFGKKVIFAKAKADYESLAEWADVHVGEAAKHHLLNPMCSGIYAATPDELAVDIAFPSFQPKSGKTLLSHLLAKKKQTKHRAKIMTPAQGMGQLIEALDQFILSHPKASLHLNHHLTSLPNVPNIIITTPADVATLLVNDEKIKQALLRVQYAPLISATIFVDSARAKKIKGVGVLYSACESRDSLGILFNSASFDHRSSVASFTMMLGGTKNPKLLIQKDEDLQQLIRQELATVLGLREGIKAIHLHRWPKAIPVYSKQLAQDLRAIDMALRQSPGLMLFGNYTGQVSLRGMAETLAFSPYFC